MRIVDDVTTKLIDDGEEKNTSPTSEIIFKGQPTGKIVIGVTFQLAVTLDNFYLLFITNNNIFEETLNIYLLDKELKLLDSSYIFLMYGTGIFSLVALQEPNIIRFNFFNNSTFILKVLPHLEFRLPFISEPVGVNRKFGFSRHFVIYQDKISYAKNNNVMQDCLKFYHHPNDGAQLLMRVANEINTKLITDSIKRKTLPQSEIIINEKSIGRTLSGEVFQGAICIENYYLIFLTDNQLFTQRLHIHFLDDELNMLDTARLYWKDLNSKFVLRGLLEPDRVHFEFFNSDFYVKVLNKSEFYFPRFSEPNYIFRNFGFSRHFIIY